jgi:hypothetical protein
MKQSSRTQAYKTDYLNGGTATVLLQQQQQNMHAMHNNSGSSKYRNASYQQHINNYLADSQGTYYVAMRGSADAIG